ncbi:type I-F CRISPR-associated helicase Cas3f [Testudinibacter aquarius]|uniref:CRISPR-associated Cas3 family helicase n=1 Tax=Testudinibacter aquarius TaxID=1524974 RepID=A0A4R3Y8R0_9PAST|nr:type I-F CRISPR-associated helicase Cas3f [Testudinibacter aquarius]KAE9530178.1 hypothetical protein A1D24_06825 [Testudinibacter aquarius]TCV87961.1 CRISPR-associated Cas3 family helicase [Testudinibacter aquarius]TNG90239.1 type I-F CRISPR-associated helicase Cas3 [Testudinibacter aquarius]
MMVLFVSQCEKKSLSRTRKVLDAFANRIGDNTWQTVITEDGLQMLRRLLRQTATRNTAVSCHWIRTRARSDLLWIVGNRKRFNQQGIVPVNRTRRNLLHSEWENHWQHITSIQIIATLAALFHDLGKSTIGFQRKLRESGIKGDPYRHEWISLKIVEWLLLGCDSDHAWLMRLTDLGTYLHNPVISLEQFLQQNRESSKIADFPPLAQWIGWLIVTHHRTAPFDKVRYVSSTAENLKSGKYFKQPLSIFYKQLKAVDCWVKNTLLLDSLSSSKQADYWRFDSLVLKSAVWQKAVKRWANKALQHPLLMQLSEQAVSQQKGSIDDSLLLQFSRLCLMMADYHYSSLDSEDKRRVFGDKAFIELAANTDRETKAVKQSLDEHLLGVANAAAQFARILPVVATELPTLKQQDSLIQNSSITRFSWQNKAFQLAKSVQQQSEEQGFFGVNMASTGCGKTIGNARIMYALADKEKGARFTVALGLRVLTLQTGQSYRDNLGLNAEQLAILVGGNAQRQLYEVLNKNSDQQGAINELPENNVLSTVWGSESAAEILNEVVDSEIDYSQYDNLNLERLLDSQKANSLLFSPIAVCTVDHLIQATECKRGGQYMLPVLRLLSSDLVLDEPDDFDQADLPALSRLVHLSGLLGGRVLLSSATLPPDLIQGLFNAYLAGRVLYHRHQNKAAPQVVCAWIDEQQKAMKTALCKDSGQFCDEHLAFIRKRLDFLHQQPIRRFAAILPFNTGYSQGKIQEFFDELAQTLANAAISLHQQYHVEHPVTNQGVSVGLIRIANTKNIIEIAKAFMRGISIAPDIHLHLCCYHAKQLLLLRNILESRLDRILKRDMDCPERLFQQSDIVEAMQQYPEKQHIFIVLATPIAEVGRDHDYDWAIAEPSSMRSLIQLAGRIWRHRPNKIATTPNLLILQKNIRALEHPGEVAFTRPGFESNQFKLETHDMQRLMPLEQLQRVDASVRINKAEILQANSILTDLEHRVIQDLMNNNELNLVNAYWRDESTSNRVCSHLQILSPFRAGQTEEEWLLIPNGDNFDVYSVEQVRMCQLAHSATHNAYIQYQKIELEHSQVSAWLNINLAQGLKWFADYQAKIGLKNEGSKIGLALKYSSVALADNTHGWIFNEWLGFWRNK